MPQRKPLVDTGERLATFPRGDSEELRVTLAEFKGHRYISLRVWSEGPDGNLYPCPGKGCSVRLREAKGVAEALLAALRGDKADDVGTTDATLRKAQPRQSGPAPRATPKAKHEPPGPRPGTIRGGFDEFDDEAPW
jgi:hypothetical protein